MDNSKLSLCKGRTLRHYISAMSQLKLAANEMISLGRISPELVSFQYTWEINKILELIEVLRKRENTIRAVINTCSKEEGRIKQKNKAFKPNSNE